LLLQNIWPYAHILPDQSAEKLCQKPHSPQGKSFCLEAAGLLTYSISAPSQPYIQASGKRTETLISLWAKGTYSSGNCCRISRHSLLIPRAWLALRNRFQEQR
jgi:hypothetical protein